MVSGFWDGLPVRSNPWAGENPRVLAEIRTRMFGLSPMPDGPPDARIAAQIGRTLVEGMSGYAAFYRQGQARVSVYALRSADPPQWMRPSPVRRDDSAGRAIARISSGQVAVLAVGDPGPCFASLERHLRSVVSTSAALQTTSPVSLLLDRAYVRDVRARAEKGDAAIAAAIAALEAEAKKALAISPMSVMDKAITPPSGDKHDYVSQAPYWWPDPSKPDGKPYIRKDGERNPEISKITDRDNLGRLGDAVATLSLAYAYTGREEYATHAARLVRAWFVDPATRMNPHLQFGQYIPGINQGRGIGIIETRNLPELLDGVMLLSGSPAWTKADEDGLQAWMRAYLTWLVESPHGREESKNGNNHETWYDVQVAGLALYTGQVDVARRTLEGARARIATQIEPDGRQPRELERTRSWHYSEFNLAAFMDLATLGSARRRRSVELPDARRPRHPASRGLPGSLRRRRAEMGVRPDHAVQREHDAYDPAPRRGRLEGAEIQGAGGSGRRRRPEADPHDSLSRLRMPVDLPAQSPRAPGLPDASCSSQPHTAGLLAQHDQQHARHLGRPNGVRDVGGHQHDRLRCRLNVTSADRQGEAPGEGEDKRIERRRVLRQLFARVEGKQGDVASRCARQHTTGNALCRWRHQGVQGQELAGL